MAPNRKQVVTKSFPKSNTRSAVKKSSKATMASASTAATPSTSKAEDSNGSIYFWREYGTEHCFLSQWYKSEFTTDDDPDLVYKNAEQYMMYHKALLFNDKAVAAEILNSTDPKKIKALGRHVKPFVEATWLSNRERIVEEASYFKFKNGKAYLEDERDERWNIVDLKQALLETGERELIEASPRDKIWGIGFAKDSVPVDRKRWGMNLLGKALMDARSRLKAEEEGQVNGDAKVNEVEK